jgi:hypothetical protein
MAKKGSGPTKTGTTSVKNMPKMPMTPRMVHK